MINSCQKLANKPRRRLKIVFAILGLVAAVYSGSWFILALLLHNYATLEIQSLQQNKQFLDCNSLHIAGYPLRIGLNCQQFSFTDTALNLNLTTQKAVIGAPIYAPSWYTLVLHPPGRLNLPGAGTIDALWQNMTFGGDFTQGEASDIVWMAENLRINLADLPAFALDEPVIVYFLRLQFTDTTPEQRISLSFEQMRLPKIDKLAVQIPSMNGVVNLRLEKPTTNIIFENRPPLSGQLEKFHLEFLSGGSIDISGNFHFSSTGVLSGIFTATLQKISALRHTIRAQLPKQSGSLASNMDALFFAFQAMPKDGQGNPTIIITIDNGFVRAGFIALGELPRLPFPLF